MDVTVLGFALGMVLASACPAQPAVDAGLSEPVCLQSAPATVWTGEYLLVAEAKEEKAEGKKAEDEKAEDKKAETAGEDAKKAEKADKGAKAEGQEAPKLKRPAKPAAPGRPAAAFWMLLPGEQ